MFLTIDRGKSRRQVRQVESGHNEIILTVLKKNPSYLYIFDVFDDDL